MLREEKSSISNVSNNHADKPVNKELDSELQTNEISEERGTGEKDAASTEATKHLARLQEKLKLTEQDRTKLQKVKMMAAAIRHILLKYRILHTKNA